MKKAKKCNKKLQKFEHFKLSYFQLNNTKAGCCSNPDVPHPPDPPKAKSSNGG